MSYNVALSNVVPFEVRESSGIEDNLIGLFEALIFSYEKPVSVEQLARAAGCSEGLAREVIAHLKEMMGDKSRGITLVMAGERVEIIPKPEHNHLVRTMQDKDMDVLKAVVDEFLHVKQVKGLAEGTLYGYRLTLERFVEHVSKPVDEIKARDIRLFLMTEERERNNSRNTIARKTTVLRSFFEWLERDEIIEKNPMRKIEIPQTDDPEPKFLTHEEIEMVREVIEKPIDHAIFETMYSSGIRISEAVDLNWSDIDFSEKSLRVRKGKGGKSRTTLLSTKAVMVLKKYKKQRNDNDEFVFRSRYKKRMTRSSIYYHIKKLARNAGIAHKMTPHSLRHSFGTHLLRSGIPIDMVQVLLGHSDVSTTQVYSRTDKTSIDQHYRVVFP